MRTGRPRYPVVTGPIFTTSRSLPFTFFSVLIASLSQRGSGAPVMNQSLPLSARIMPYFLRAVRITWCLRRIRGDVEIGLEADAHAHGRKGGVFFVAGVMGGGGDVAFAGFDDGEANGVGDFLFDGDFVVADEAGEDGEAGGVGAGPAFFALGGGGFGKVEHRPAAALPGAVFIPRTPEFVELVFFDVDAEDVAVAGGVGAAGEDAFDLDVVGDGVGAFVGFVGVLEFDVVARGFGVDELEGDAVFGAPVGMQRLVSADLRDDGGGLRIDRLLGNIAVPFVLLGEDGELGEKKILGCRFDGRLGGGGLGGGRIRGGRSGENDGGDAAGEQEECRGKDAAWS